MNLTHRQQIGIYLAVTLALSWLLEWYMIKNGGVNTAMMIVLMWIPGLVAIACSFAFGAQAHDLGLHGVIPKYWILAYAVPAAVSLLVMIVSATIGIGTFDVGFVSSIRGAIILPILGVVISLFTHSVSELGWRGFLHTHVQHAKIPAPYLFVGIVWSAWLWPLVAFSDYTQSRTPILSLLMFTITMTGFSIFLGWLRGRSRAVLPVMLAFAVHITWLREITPAFYKPGDADPYFGGETGFIMAILYFLIAAYIYRREEGFLQVY